MAIHRNFGALDSAVRDYTAGEDEQTMKAGLKILAPLPPVTHA